MGAWDVYPLSGDDGADFKYEIEEAGDLSPIAELFERIEETDGYIDLADGGMALAACDILARIRGHAGYHDAYTESIDEWIAANPQDPPADLYDRALKIFERVTGEDSETQALWAESEDYEAWLKAMADLRSRLTST